MNGIEAITQNDTKCHFGLLNYHSDFSPLFFCTKRNSVDPYTNDIIVELIILDDYDLLFDCALEAKRKKSETYISMIIYLAVQK